jgi:AraC-like DNA-binding protein
MSRNGAWAPAKFRRYEYDLSPQQPLRVHETLNESLVAAHYDMHYVLELGIICRGRMHRGYENFSLTAGPGDVWLCGMWEPHESKVVQVPCHRVVMVINPQMLAELRNPEAPDYDWLAPFKLPPERRPQTLKSQRKEMLSLADRFIGTLEMDEPRRTLWQRVLLMELLLLLRRREQDALIAPPQSVKANERIGRAVDRIFTSRGMASPKEAATHCGISRSRFDNVFQHTMGVTYAKFALRYRLSNAATQLVQGDDPVKSIAAEWGFTDASHLTRAFAAHYGVTPGEYRMANRKPPGESRL